VFLNICDIILKQIIKYFIGGECGKN